ncbi:MAG: hypothetical protein WA602_17420, partial [Silvibacterium sp.]
RIVRGKGGRPFSCLVKKTGAMLYRLAGLVVAISRTVLATRLASWRSTSPWAAKLQWIRI